MDALYSDTLDSKAHVVLQAPAWRRPWIEELLEILVVVFILVGVFAPIMMLQWTMRANENFPKKKSLHSAEQNGSAIYLTFIEPKTEQPAKGENRESTWGVSDEQDVLNDVNALSGEAPPNLRDEPEEKLSSNNKDIAPKATDIVNSHAVPTSITLQKSAIYSALKESVGETTPINEAVQGSERARGAIVFDPNFRRAINRAENQRIEAGFSRRLNVGLDYVDSSGDLHAVADNGCEFRRSQSSLVAEDQWFFVGCDDPDEIKLRYSSTIRKPSFYRQQ